MRKVWNTLVVLGILLCMVMSLGVTADAAEGDTAIFAVSGAQLTAESIDVMKTQCPDCLVVDVDGLADGQSALGYDVVYAQSDPGVMSDYAYIWPGFAQMFYVGADSSEVVLVGVGEASTADEVAAAIAAFLGDDPYVIAVGPASAAAAVGGCADVDMFLTVDLEDTAAAGAVQAVNVGKQEEAPVSLVKINDDGTAAAEAIPVPQPVADPNVGPAEQDSQSEGETEGEPEGETEGEPESGDNGADTSNGLVTAPGPVIDAPETDAPETVIYYAVKYDGNGRDEGTYVDDDLQVAGGSEYVLRDNGYTREGYDFVGWTLDAPDAEPVYQPGDTIVVSSNVTVYAKWAEITAAPADSADSGEGDEGDGSNGGTTTVDTTAALTVTYKPGEGTGAEVKYPFTETSKDIVLPDILPDGSGIAFTPPEGKKLSGWLLEGTEELYDVLAPYTATTSVSFVAQYKTVYTVTYDFGDSGNENYSVEVFEGSVHGLAAAPAVIPEGKTFGGWLVNGEQKNAGDEITVTASVTVTPVWTGGEPEVVDVAGVTVTYKGGIEGMDDKPTTVSANSKFNLPDCPFTVPDGQVFVGWKLEGGDGTVLAVNAEFTVGTDNVAFVAQWAAKVTVTVTYQPDNGSDKTFTETTAGFTSGESVNHPLAQLPADFTAPTGKIFGGWKIGEKTYQPGESVLLSADTTVTAVWVDAPVEEKEVDSIKQDWDRAQNLIIDFAQYNRGNPIKLELLRAYEKDESGAYKKDENGNYIPVWQERANGKDYSISGTSMTFYPSMLGTWNNQQYGFRVTFDGAGTDKGTNTMLVYLNVTGTTPTTAPTATAAPTAAPTATPNGPTSPATGDNNNVTLYIVLLVVLIAALAAVLIVVMKRRKQ